MEFFFSFVFFPSLEVEVEFFFFFFPSQQTFNSPKSTRQQPSPPLLSLSLNKQTNQPHSFRKLLKHVSDTYSPRDPATGRVLRKIEVRVTESGCDGPGEDKTPLPAVLRDDFRVSYFRGYVEAAERAVLDDGVELTSYAAWSILDNFEWREGYSSRFGIVYTDYGTQERHPKDSARWLSRKFSSGGKARTASRAEIEEMRRQRKALLLLHEEDGEKSAVA